MKNSFLKKLQGQTSSEPDSMKNVDPVESTESKPPAWGTSPQAMSYAHTPSIEQESVPNEPLWSTTQRPMPSSPAPLGVQPISSSWMDAGPVDVKPTAPQQTSWGPSPSSPIQTENVWNTQSTEPKREMSSKEDRSTGLADESLKKQSTESISAHEPAPSLQPKTQQRSQTNASQSNPQTNLLMDLSFTHIKQEKVEEIERRMRDRLNKVFGQDISNKKDDPTFKEEIRKALLVFLGEERVNISEQEKQKFVQYLVYDILGFGILQPLIDDPTITEIMVVGPSKVYIERNGQLALTGYKFPSKQSVKNVIDKIIAPIGRRCDESSPNVDARLPDGSRVSASISPIALDGPYITIRKFFKKTFLLPDYISRNSLNSEMASFLEACVKGGLNIVVSGGTGSGKTTLLNCLSNYIPEKERIITIEDSAELQLSQPHVERYESRNANMEGKGEISIRDLVKYSLRKRPDRIVVGEIRGGEAMDMLQAMNTGHDGSLTTGHANDPKQMINRLETMALMSGLELPSKAIRETIGGAVQLIVQVSRMKDGSRKITHITEVLGYGQEGSERAGLKTPVKDSVVLKDIFRYVQTGMNEKGELMGHFESCGYEPYVLERLMSKGIIIDRNWFTTPG